MRAAVLGVVLLLPGCGMSFGDIVMPDAFELHYARGEQQRVTDWEDAWNDMTVWWVQAGLVWGIKQPSDAKREKRDKEARRELLDLLREIRALEVKQLEGRAEKLKVVADLLEEFSK